MNNIHTFQDALDYLYSFVSYEHKAHWDYSAKTLNIERFKEFLAQLDSPQLKINTIHVAGSDGKGSVCAMITAVLQSLGYKVGLYTSPHLESIRERIQINQEWIPEEAFVILTELLKQTNDGLPLNSQGYATFFELITAMAFLYFQQEQVDFAVIETGMGGRLDATNVMEPILTVITHLSLEHTDRLGKTIEAIAYEKLGIRRDHAPLIIAEQSDAGLHAIKQQLENHPSPVVYVQEIFQVIQTKWQDHIRHITYKKNEEGKTIQIPMAGEYQIANALTAIAAVETLKKTKQVKECTCQDLQEGLMQTHWPGRFEIIQTNPLVILDVAHTVRGAEALRHTLDTLYPMQKRWFVIGFLKDKDKHAICDRLLRDEDHIIFTQAPSPRGASTNEILNEINQVGIIQTEYQPESALTLALKQAQAEDLVIVTGSIYLVGLLRQRFDQPSNH